MKKDERSAPPGEGAPEEEKKVAVPAAEYEKLKEEEKRSAERLEQILRLRAEFENFHKRLAREKEEFSRFANAELIRKLLDIIDDLERAIASAQTHENHEKLISGLKMILSRINDTLRERGLRKMEVLGKAFDPHLHEAVLQVESDEHPEGVVVEELQAGYLLGERVIRHARVTIAKKPTKREEGLKQEEEN